jgi:hypothetical protein
MAIGLKLGYTKLAAEGTKLQSRGSKPLVSALYRGQNACRGRRTVRCIDFGIHPLALISQPAQRDLAQA